MSLVVRPEEYKHEILTLSHEEGYTQAQIVRYFQEKYGAELKRSTLSDFLKGQPKAGRVEGLQDDDRDRVLPPSGAHSEGQIAEQFVGLAQFSTAFGDEVIEKLAHVIEGVQQIKTEADTRYEALSGKVDTLRKQLRGEVPRATLRRIWGRTFAAWLLVFTLFFVWQPLLVPKTAMQIRGQGEVLWSTVAVWVWGPSAVPAKPARRTMR